MSAVLTQLMREAVARVAEQRRRVAEQRRREAAVQRIVGRRSQAPVRSDDELASARHAGRA